MDHPWNGRTHILISFLSLVAYLDKSQGPCWLSFRRLCLSILRVRLEYMYVGPLGPYIAAGHVIRVRQVILGVKKSTENAMVPGGQFCMY